MDTEKFKRALEAAKASPNAPAAIELRKRIEAGNFNEELRSLGKPTFNEAEFKEPEAPAEEEQPEEKKPGFFKKVSEKMEDFSKGVAKGELQLFQGMGALGTKIGEKTVGRLVEAVTDEGLDPNDIFKEGTDAYNRAKEITEAENGTEAAGKFIEQVAEFAIPGNAATKITKAMPWVTKVLTRAGVQAGVGTVQEGEFGKNAKTAGIVEAAIPGAGKVLKPVVGLVKRFFKGLGAGLSGVSSQAIEEIASNPKAAGMAVDEMKRAGQFPLIERNAQTVMNGIANVRKEARTAYGNAMQALKEVDIDPKKFRQGMQEFLDKYKISSKGPERILEGVEFEDPKNIQRASNLIDDISRVKLDGLSFRRLLEKIDNAKFKIATSDERLAFNAFVNDLSANMKNVINQATDKLADANSAFTKDMQIVEGMERVFGKIKFKNAKELAKVSEKLESLFSQKGLTPRDFDNFMNRIGIKPGEFRATEAARQMTERPTKANTTGLSVGELIQQVTSSVVKPEVIRDIARAVGWEEQTLRPVLDKLAPTARATFIKLLIGDGE